MHCTHSKPMVGVHSSRGCSTRRTLVNAFPHSNRDFDTIRDVTSVVRVMTDGLAVFTFMYCGLNWITYRRIAAATEMKRLQDEKKNKKK